MKKEIESVILRNKKGQALRIYRVEGSDEFCIGLEGDGDHFSFKASEASEITGAIDQVVDSFD